MNSVELQDLASVDRDVKSANAALVAWRRDVARDPDANAEQEPLARTRHVAGRAGYLAMLGHPDARKGGETPHREALARWIAHLTLARLTHDLEGDLARARIAKDAKYTLGEGRMVGFADAMRALPRVTTAPEVLAWLDAAAEGGGEVAGLTREIRARREEAAMRLDVSGTWALATRVPKDVIVTACETFLNETRPLARDVLKEQRSKAETTQHPSALDALRVLLARDAPEGWPARLTQRWLIDLFPRLIDGLRLDVPTLPDALGASSFARALAQFGYALRVAGPSRSLPFAIAQDPNPIDAHRFSNAFGSLAASPEFQRRALGNAVRVADAQARVLARSLLFTARVDAARVVLAQAPDRFEEHMHAIFDVDVPRGLAGAWPLEREDEPARAAAMFTSLPFTTELVDRFDIDWFKNPRAAMFLRARASAPAWEDVHELPATAAHDLARAFEGAAA